MSIPGFAWARERGRTLGLPALDRLLLMVLSDMANGARVCWPLLQTLMLETGIRKRALITTLQRLEAAGLIRIEKWGRSQRYHILRPIDDGEQVHHTHRSNGGRVHDAHQSPTNGARAAPKPVDNSLNGAANAPVNGAPSAPDSHERCTSGLRKVHQTTGKGAPDAPRTFKRNQEREPSGAREAHARGKAGINSHSSQGHVRPAPTTTPSHLVPSAPYASPDEARATFAAYLAAKRREAHGEPEEPVLEARAPARAVKRAAAATIYALRKYAPAVGAKPERSRDEQLEGALAPPGRADVIGEILPPNSRRVPLDPVRTVAEQLAALGYPQAASPGAPP